MFRHVLVLLLICSIGAIAAPLPRDEISDALAYAEALYYEAKFNEAIQLLTRVDGLLQTTPGRLQEKTNVKLQLALVSMGLNETGEAKSYLRQLFTVNPDYRLDPQQFSPKVMTLAEEVKGEVRDARCQTAIDNAETHLQTKNASALIDLIRSMKPQCPQLEKMQPDAADLLYKTGVEAYKRNDFLDALNKFNGAVQLAPEHQMAPQYVELTENKLQIAADRLVLQWRKNFDARQFALAAADYRQIGTFNYPSAKPIVNQLRAEYRNSVSTLVQSWNRACASNDTATMDTIRRQISELLPEPSIAADLVAQTATCTPSNTDPRDDPDAVVLNVNTNRDCLQMGAPVAMTRLKARMNPVIPPALQDFLRHGPVSVRVKAKIDEKGDVTVTNTQGTNPAFNDAVRTAVERWKFQPTVDENGPRCVETELPIIMNPGSTSGR